MKKYIIAMVALLSTFFTTANAMSYEQAREQALFLTDKMAYELNLDEEQYEAAYEVNLDYLLSVNTYDDVFADYWIHRNEDLRYILLDWQYEAFCAASYFYRPLWWEGGYWHFGIYARYPHRDYFYFGRPHFYVTYRGGHGWHHNGGRSWYHTNFSHAHRVTHRGSFSGMRDGWNRGDYQIIVVEVQSLAERAILVVLAMVLVVRVVHVQQLVVMGSTLHHHLLLTG